MTDISDVGFQAFEKGYIVNPKSDEKIVFIPSPPTQTVTMINPRPVVILVSETPVDEGYVKLEELKAFAKEQKVVIVCMNGSGTEDVEATYEYVRTNAKPLNVKKDNISVQYMGDMEEKAQELADYLVDELDAELDDATEFTF